MLSLHTLPSLPGKKRQRVGRGNSSSGNYSGRGMKGQRARSGGKGGLKLRGIKQSMMAIPKLRGFKSIHPKPQVVSLATLEKMHQPGDTVTVTSLHAAGLIANPKRAVKVLASGKLSKALTVQLQQASATAKQAIEKAGGTFTQVR